jgi:hypothetical protein
VVSALTSGSGVWLIFERPGSGLAIAAFVTGAFFFLAAVVVPLGVTRRLMSPPGLGQPRPAAAAAGDLLTVTLRT